MTRNFRNKSRSRAWRALVALAVLATVLATAAIVGATTAPDFSVSAAPSSQTIDSGYSASYTMSVTPSNGFTGTVTLTAGSIPKGMSPSWTVGSTTTTSASVNVAVPAGSLGAAATLTLSGGQPTAGTYNPTVTGTSGLLKHATTLTLFVQNQNGQNFQLAVSPASQTVVQGASTSSSVVITRQNWTGAVGFASAPVSGLPAGASATVSPISTSGSSATLTITTSSTTPPQPGVYTLALTGTATLSGNSQTARYAGLTLAVVSKTATSITAPGTDATGTPIAASSISSTLSGATSGATGTITFTVFGPQSTAPSSCTSGGTTIGTATVSGGGTYHPASGYTPSTAGTYWWYASYGGDSYNSASASTCGTSMTSTVVENTTATTATAPATGTATAAIPSSAVGSTLSGATGGASGTITFKVFGPQSTAPGTCTTGGTTTGTATVSGNGTYHPNAGFTPAVGGTYWWYASYSGDGFNSPSASPCGSGMAPTVVQDFAISASPSSQSALTGGTSPDTAAYTVTVTPFGGFAGAVNLSVASGLPGGGTTWAFNPPSTSGQNTSQSALTVTVGTTATPGTYTLTIQGSATINGTPVSRTAQVTLVVNASHPFKISGDVPSPLYPGAAAQPFTLTISNPNSYQVTVTGLSVTVQPPNPSYCLSSWFKVTMPSVPAGGLVVPANGSVSETATAQMLESGSNQDACEAKALTLSYSGSYAK